MQEHSESLGPDSIFYKKACWVTCAQGGWCFFQISSDWCSLTQPQQVSKSLMQWKQETLFKQTKCGSWCFFMINKKKTLLHYIQCICKQLHCFKECYCCYNSQGKVAKMHWRWQHLKCWWELIFSKIYM